MKTNKKFWHCFFIAFAAMLFSTTTKAQVTIGADIVPTRATLLDLKMQQTAGTVPDVLNTANATSTTGGLLLPRVQLKSTNTMEPFIATTDPEWTANTNSLKEKLAGLMVYNLTNANGLYPGVYTWDGTQWTTSQVNKVTALYVSAQPQKFTFYETLTSGTIAPLTFTVSGGVAPIAYQWYRVTGNNVHVRIGTALTTGTGPKTTTYTPTQIKTGDGDTRNAARNGFYRFYCVATDGSGNKIESDISEIAVGCGAKNNAGEWLSFMCFNLGADNNSTIDSQKAYSFGTAGFTNDADGIHIYQASEEKLFGDLFQWGRIPDGHEKRQSMTLAFGAMTTSEIADGMRCSATDVQRPNQQIKKTSNWYGKFITTALPSGNWYPGTVQATADQLWRNGRFMSNDPCAHYKVDGTYQEFWHEGTDTQTNSDACTDGGTGWRLPNQQEWGDIYRGGILSGSPGIATANTWKWLNGSATPITDSRGFEILPDGTTTTLFLSASGYRRSTALLCRQGVNGIYWSSSAPGANAYALSFTNGSVDPTSYTNGRVYGYAIRCTKN